MAAKKRATGRQGQGRRLAGGTSARISPLFARIERAREARSIREDSWEDLERQLGPDGFATVSPEGLSDEETVLRTLDVNLPHSTFQSAVPRVLLTRPRLVGQARRAGSERAAALMEHVDDYHVDELRMVPEWRQCAADATVYGIGILKIAYIPSGSDYERVSQQSDVLDLITEATEAITGEAPEQAEAFAEADPSALIDPFKKRKMFFVQRISPRNFLFDPMADEIRQLRWVAHEYVMPVSAIKKERRFGGAKKRVKATKFLRDKVDRGNLLSPGTEPQPFPDGAGGTVGDRGKTDEEGFDTLVEIWDWENQRLVTIADSVPDTPLQDVEWPYPGLEGFPFAFLRYNMALNGVIPISDLEAARPQADELRYIRRKRALHLRRFNRKYTADTDQMGEDWENRLQELVSGIDGAIVRTPPGLVQPIPDAPTSPDYDRHEVTVRTDYREITGQSELERGGSLGSGGTATEAAILDANSRLRSGFRIGLMEEFIEDSFRILNALLRSFLPASIAVKIRGLPEAGEDWLEIRRADIQGEYDIKVVAGSTLPVTQESRKRQLIELFQILSPLIQAGAISPLPLLKEIVDAYGIQNAEEFLQIPQGGGLQSSPLMQPQQFQSGAAGSLARPRATSANNPLATALGLTQGLGS